MKPVFSLLAAIAMILIPGVSQAAIGVISPQEAKALIESPEASKRPIVLDTRGGYKDYFRGHLPTAHHMEFDTLRGTDAGVPVQYLPDEMTEKLLQRAGVQKNRTHIVYATGASLPNDEILSATMVAYVLEKFGIQDIRILDGGLPGWKDAGFASTQDYFGNSLGKLPGKKLSNVGLKLEQVLKQKAQPGTLLVDARPKNEYLGQDDVWVRKGHIPGAISFHWARLMDPANTHKFRPFSETKAELEAAGITPDKNIIAYCGTSREGSLLRFYLKHVAGYPNVNLYEGSWKEYAWTQGKSLPAETTENVAKR